MLEKIHGKHKTLAYAVTEVRAVLGRLVDAERQLATLYELQSKDPKRHLQSDVRAYPLNKLEPMIFSVEIPIDEVIRQKRDELIDLIHQADDAEKLVNEAYLRLLNYDTEPLQTKIPSDKVELPIGKPLVGPGRTE